MPRGDKSKYTDKQKRQAEHIAEGYEEQGVGEKESQRRAWATVNKTTGGGKQPGGAGRGKKSQNRPSDEGASKGRVAKSKQIGQKKAPNQKKAPRKSS